MSATRECLVITALVFLDGHVLKPETVCVDVNVECCILCRILGNVYGF